VASETAAPPPARTLRIAQASWDSGQRSTLIVEFDAQGNENALGFSLGFDPARVRFVSGTLGDDAPNATLQLNTSSVPDGHLGIALALPTGQTLAAGTRRLLAVTLVGLGNGDPVSQSVLFSDLPVTREVSDSEANALPASYATDAPLPSGVSPHLLSANGDGHGIAAAVALRVSEDGTRRFEPVLQFDATLRRFIPIPIDLGSADEQVFLILFGTRSHFRAAGLAGKIGGVTLPALYAGATPGFAGLDQIHLGPIPRSLIGHGEIEVTVMAEGRALNPVRINIR
jgi:hypothetical protein